MSGRALAPFPLAYFQQGNHVFCFPPTGPAVALGAANSMHSVGSFASMCHRPDHHKGGLVNFSRASTTEGLPPLSTGQAAVFWYRLLQAQPVFDLVRSKGGGRL